VPSSLGRMEDYSFVSESVRAMRPHDVTVLNPLPC